MKIGIDFDGTLTDTRMRKIARMLVHASYLSGERMNDVWVVTARDQMDDFMRNTLFDAHIPPDKVIFTYGDSKWDIIEKMGFDILIDNDNREISGVADHTNCVPLLFKVP